MVEILQTSLIISLFCVSWDILLTYEPNEPKKNQMLLYFFRKMEYDYIDRLKEQYNKAAQRCEKEYHKRISNITASNDSEEYLILMKSATETHQWMLDCANKCYIQKTNWLFYLKPILTCKYCFPSFYGTIIFIMLHGFHVEQWATWLLSIVCSVILVGIISGIHEKLIK